MAQKLLNPRVMRTTGGSTSPWGSTTVDDGWKDLVVSSAPPPPPPAREDAPVKNRALPTNFNTWQEHGSTRAAAAAAVVEEPSFSKSDRRLWLIAGTLMGAAVLVLAALGLLTFGPSSGAAAVAATSSPAPAADATQAAALAHPARAVEPPHGVAVAPKSSNPRVLKTAAHSSRGRHHKHVSGPLARR